jgi:hypothetical protein
MKKLIFAAAAVAGMGAFALESANVVGYTEYKTETKKQPSFGACFMPLDGSASYKLKDLVPSNFDADNDMIQVINPSTLATDATYVYFSKEFADAAASEEGEPAGAFDELIGWWNPSYDIGDELGASGEVPVNVGQAFLGLFESGNDIKFQSSGSVPLTSTGISTDAKKQPFFANYLPKAIKLGGIVPENFDADNDMIQVINPSTLTTDATYVYFSKEFADAAASEEGEPAGAFDELIGWWNPSYDIGDEDGFANNVDVAAGAAFLGLFESGNNITFKFPAAL